MMNDLNKTLNELLPLKLDEPIDDETSYLVKTAYKLMNKKLSDFTIEDLRLMIGQQIGLQYLVPLALDILEENPFAEGDFYEGDLLMAILRIDSTFWKAMPLNKKRADGILLLVKSKMNDLDLVNDIRREIMKWIS